MDPAVLRFAFRPLWQLSAAEQAGVALQKAQATAVYAGLQLWPTATTAVLVRSQLIEDGVYPGAGAAFAATADPTGTDPQWAQREVADYNPEQPRNERGEWIPPDRPPNSLHAEARKYPSRLSIWLPYLWDKKPWNPVGRLCRRSSAVPSVSRPAETVDIPPLLGLQPATRWLGEGNRHEDFWTMNTIKSAGGPLVCINRSQLSLWGGMAGISFADKNAGFESDYDAAGALTDGTIQPPCDIAQITGPYGSALLITMPLQTAVVQQSEGVAYIAQCHSASPEWTFDSLDHTTFYSIGFDAVGDFSAAGGPFLIFDSADAGNDSDKQYIELRLEEALYEIATAYVEPDEATMVGLIRLTKR